MILRFPCRAHRAGAQSYGVEPCPRQFRSSGVFRSLAVMPSIKQTPDHHDAELLLKLYDLRRESVMRESRKAIVRFHPRTYEEFVAITNAAHEDNAAFRQVSSYFEMAYSFARHGICHPDLLAESAGEGLLLFAKIRPFLERFRREVSPTAFTNTEWLVEHSASAKQRLEMFQARIAKQAAGK
jgi:hypothetical protein